MSFECEFCHHTFKRAVYMTTHQSSTRRCLAIQKNLGHTSTVVKLLECNFCKKTHTTLYTHEKHLVKCKAKLKQENESATKKLVDTSKTITSIKNTIEDRLDELSSDLRNYKEEIEYTNKIHKDKVKNMEENHRIKEEKFEKEISLLKKQIQDLMKKPNIETGTSHSKNKTINSHNTTHITIQTIMTPEKVEEFFKKNYNLDTLLEGQKGLARFINDGFLKSAEEPIYRCTDRARQKFVMKQEDGTHKEDTNCEQLVQLTKPGMEHVSDVYETSLFEKLPDDIKEIDIHNGYRNISDLGKDRDRFKNELSKIIPEEVRKPSNTDVWDKMKAKIQTIEPIIDSLENPIPKNDIGGISRGKLLIYRDRFRKDGTIKYPKSLQERLDSGDTSFQNDYLEFIYEK